MLKIIKTTAIILFCLNTALLFPQRITTLKTDDGKAAYAIGLNLAQNFILQGFDKTIDLEIMRSAMLDKFKKKELLFPEDSLNSFMSNYISKQAEENREKNKKASYFIGLSLAKSFKPQGFDEDIDLNILIQAMKDKFESKELLFSEDSIQAFMKNYIPKHTERLGKRNLETGQKFLENNKKKSGVKTTTSGLQYKVEKDGDGDKPTEEDLVTINYVLKTIDGSVIEDSKKINGPKSADIPLSKVISGWKEGMMLMSKGSKYTLYLPAYLAYGELGPVGPNQILIFEIELIDFKSIPKPKEEVKEIETQEESLLTPEQEEQFLLEKQFQQEDLPKLENLEKTN